MEASRLSKHTRIGIFSGGHEKDSKAHRNSERHVIDVNQYVCKIRQCTVAGNAFTSFAGSVVPWQPAKQSIALIHLDQILLQRRLRQTLPGAAETFKLSPNQLWHCAVLALDFRKFRDV